MLAIKLARTGKKKYPTYSLIVVEKSKDPWGDYTEKVGSFNPHSKALDLKKDRLEYWLKIGAQPTPTVHNLLVAEGLIKGEKVRAGKSQPGKKRLAEIEASKKAEEEAKAKAEADKLAAEKAAKAQAEAPAEVAEEVVAENVSVEPVVEQVVEAVVEEAPAEVVENAEVVAENTEAPAVEEDSKTE